MAIITIQGVDYAQFLADIRDILQPNVAPSPTPPAPEVGGVELAQEITRLSQSRIYSLVSERGIPHSKRGGRLYFNRAELLAWVAVGKRDEK